MPNHCSNELVIVAPREVLEGIIEKHTNKTELETNLEFDTIIPYPQVCKDADKKACEESKMEGIFSDEGYKWCVDNWGTKWSAYSGDVRYTADDEVVLTFDTAWSPPEPVVKRLAQMYPSAEFALDYREEGMAFYGRLALKNGEVTEEWCKEIPEEELEEAGCDW